MTGTGRMCRRTAAGAIAAVGLFVGVGSLLAAQGCAPSARDRHYEAHSRVARPSPGDGTALSARSGQRLVATDRPRD